MERLYNVRLKSGRGVVVKAIAALEVSAGLLTECAWVFIAQDMTWRREDKKAINMESLAF
jgi:hypothetical protein